jgi:hypothetical protein
MESVELWSKTKSSANLNPHRVQWRLYCVADFEEGLISLSTEIYKLQIVQPKWLNIAANSHCFQFLDPPLIFDEKISCYTYVAETLGFFFFFGFFFVFFL